MNAFTPIKQWLGELGFLCTNKVFDIWHAFSPIRLIFEHRCTSSCVSPTMLMIMASQSKGFWLGASKWRLFICQSICGLCKMNQDNPMMIGSFEDKMTLNTTLLKCDLMVISNTLVSCVIGPKEKFLTSMISTPIDHFFHQGQLMLLHQLFVDKTCKCTKIKQCLNLYYHGLVTFDHC
jgi:hypothetical protein